MAGAPEAPELASGAADASVIRRRLRVRGAVQGVGFRPFAYRLARSLALGGFVENTTEGVTIELEGAPTRIDEFERRLPAECPPRAEVQSVESSVVSNVGEARFTIRDSVTSGALTVQVTPDSAVCGACLLEIEDPQNRRYRYPFTNCTDCGPRYSIVLALPYDRTRTTMARFEMCAACRAEYEDPLNRRFHAEPNACPDCGPHLALWDSRGRGLAFRDDALLAAAAAIRTGAIVAVKGLGGFHLFVDARVEAAVRELRRRKRREAKPFAVMMPTLREAHAHAEICTLEEDLLVAPEAPIVLVRRSGSLIAQSVAPENPYLGLLLPYTPLHHLLMASVGFPVVATSGNLTDEPICTDEHEAMERLSGIADLFLVHDRPIARHVDDSVARLVAGRPMLLRRARGYAPAPIDGLSAAPLVSPAEAIDTQRVPGAGTLAIDARRPCLAVGAHQKNAVALATGGRVFLGPHIGDLDTLPALLAFEGAIETLSRLYDHHPEMVVCDAHPDYASTQWAHRRKLPVLEVQHHYAHVLACMADNALSPPVVGVAWDGSGYGEDGTVWGGEILHVGTAGFTRVARLRPFPLPGGERAVREPRRAALGALYVAQGDVPPDAPDEVWSRFTAEEGRVLRSMLAAGLNCPRTSSAGRLFDAVAAMVGLRPVARFEGEAAMALEFALDGTSDEGTYPFSVSRDDVGWVLDWAPLILAVRHDVRAGRSTGRISRRFHDTLVEMLIEAVRRVGEHRVVLTGGCFQNKYLSERAIARLGEEGFAPYWHQKVPPNDGGIAVGQIVAAFRAGRG